MKHSKGYAGLIMLVIVALTIAVIMVRPDLLTGKKETKSTIETGFNAMDRAKDVTKQVEIKSEIPSDLLEN